MFTQTAPAPAPTSPGLVLGSTHQLSSPAAASSPASPTSRTSRIRGFSYLRNYTQTHLLSREHSGSASVPSSSQNHPNSATGTATGSSAAGSALNSTLPSPSSPTRPTGQLTRSTTDWTAACNPPSLIDGTTTPSSPARPVNTNRLTLVSPEGNTLSTSPSLVRPLAWRRSTDSELPPAFAALIPETVREVTSPAPSEGSSALVSAAPTATMTRTRSATASDATPNLDILPSIRFSTFYDPRALRPSLTFSPVSRTLPTGSEVIRVGRYSERDNQPNIPPNVPSAAPVGFKSKVVSRRHCEFWYEAGKWYIKDVKSSSGTFLNHIRLSPPGTESKPFPVNDGDIVQLGIDFKGGEEMIFRCVKMRLELNRGWQNKLNTFNMNTHKKLRTLISGSADKGGSSSQSSAQDCSICLNNIAPCQCLFVAPCSHTWHYKCIRSLLSSPSYPIFICPNCRAAADLEAEVEDPEEWEQADTDDAADEKQEEASTSQIAATSMLPPKKAKEPARSVRQQSSNLVPPVSEDADMMDVTMHDAPALPIANHNLTLPPGSVLPRSCPSNNRSLSMNATSTPIGIPTPRTASASIPNPRTGSARTPSPIAAHPAFTNGNEGPITPRNDDGPWVFDGSGARIRLGEAAAVDEMAL